MYGQHGYGLFTMGNVVIMYLPIVLDIVLGESSFKMTLRFLSFYKFGAKVWDPILVDQ